jgi:hypothetical protein
MQTSVQHLSLRAEHQGPGVVRCGVAYFPSVEEIEKENGLLRDELGLQTRNMPPGIQNTASSVDEVPASKLPTPIIMRADDCNDYSRHFILNGRVYIRMQLTGGSAKVTSE